MRIVVLNPNSSTEVTASMADCLGGIGTSGGHEVWCTELADAPIGIETDAHVAQVTPMVRDFVAEARADAVVVACFSDPGVALARAAAAIPVVGIAEAAYCTALQLADRFGVVSLGPSSVARHAAQLQRLSLIGRLAGDRPVGMTVAQGHAPEAFDAILRVGRALVEEDGAGVLILGCAGLGAKRAGLEDALGVPVVDPVQAGVATAATLLELGYGVGRGVGRRMDGTARLSDGTDAV